MYILDTDHLSLLQRVSDPLYPVLASRIAEHPQTSFYVTIVTFHEEVLGWTTYIARAKGVVGAIRGYERLERILTDFSKSQLLPFDESAGAVFDELRAARVRIGTMDLRIAAIAKSRNMTVLSRNLVDFSQVPGLTVEDWTTLPPQ